MRPGSYARRPSVWIRAGNSVEAASTEIATTMIGPAAIERMPGESTKNSAASETITVSPEKVTATPEVASAVASASSVPCPDRTSSR